MTYQPQFTVTARLLTTIERITVLRENILAAMVQVPWIPALQKDARVRNTHSSTAIEGNPLTLEQVRAIEEGRAVAVMAERAKREVLNYFSGLRFIERHARARPITHDEILTLHRLITAGVMDQGAAGRYRHVGVRVGRHVAPPPHEVSGLMRELLDWWNGDSAQWSPVITSAIAHFRFEDIHPFADGNGRTGRMLALWELYRRGFDTHHIFSVDEYYWENRPRYYRALQAVREQEGELSGWLEYVAEGIHRTLDRVWLRIERLKATRRGAPLVLRPKQERLLQLLRDHQSMTPREIWHTLNVSKQGAMDLLHPLLAAGLVRRMGTKKSGRYILA
ncbi:MAG: Fic family protein [Candidatus Omnitrophota bacterium]|nr:Fic family protein [Candidatus Omnitrophota bacterium]